MIATRYIVRKHTSVKYRLDDEIEELATFKHIDAAIFFLQNTIPTWQPPHIEYKLIVECHAGDNKIKEMELT